MNSRSTEVGTGGMVNSVIEKPAAGDEEQVPDPSLIRPCAVALIDPLGPQRNIEDCPVGPLAGGHDHTWWRGLFADSLLWCFPPEAAPDPRNPEGASSSRIRS